MVEKQSAVLLIFTGGTISMSENPATGALRPIDFERLQELMPELNVLITAPARAASITPRR